MREQQAAMDAHDAAFRRKSVAKVRNPSQYGTPAGVLNPLFNIEGALTQSELIATTITTVAGNPVRMVQELDINAFFETYNTEENSNPKLEFFEMDFVATDDAPFILYPILATLEAGQSIPATNAATFDPKDIIESGLAGHEHSVVILAELVAQRNETVDSVLDWAAKGKINLTKAIRQYFGHCSRAEFRGETAKELMFGWICRQAVPESAMSILGWKRYSISQIKRTSDFKF
jgi:hypothetical protein